MRCTFNKLRLKVDILIQFSGSGTKIQHPEISNWLNHTNKCWQQFRVLEAAYRWCVSMDRPYIKDGHSHPLVWHFSHNYVSVSNTCHIYIKQSHKIHTLLILKVWTLHSLYGTVWCMVLLLKKAYIFQAQTEKQRDMH